MEPLVIGAVFIGIPWVLGSVYRAHLAHLRFMKVLQLRADMTARLLDRMGAEPQVMEFLKSDIQQQLFEVKVAEPGSGLSMPFARMLTAIQLGLVLLSAGLAFLYIRGYMPGHSQEGLLVFGALAVALGIGAMLAAVAALIVGRFWRTLEEGRA